MMAEVKKTTARKKPKFLRTDWHKKIRLGRGVKKNQKWHGAKGRQNKFRLGRKGRGQRPKVGWGATNDTKGFVDGLEVVRVENVNMLSDHRSASFGQAFAVLIKDLRLLARAVFVIDKEGIIRYIDIVDELTHEPDYEAAIKAVKGVER